MAYDIIISKIDKDNWGKVTGLIVENQSMSVDQFINKYGNMSKETLDDRYAFYFEDQRTTKSQVSPRFTSRDGRQSDTFSL